MPIPGLRAAVLLTLAVAASSCIHPRQGRTVPGDPLILESRGAGVFARYGIPVRERTTDWRVSSGTFRADQVWGQSALVPERVECGYDGAGRARAEYMPVELSVTLRLGYRPDGTRLTLDSDGRTIPDVDSGEDSARCRLRSEFAEEILASIAGETYRDPLDPAPGIGADSWRPRH